MSEQIVAPSATFDQILTPYSDEFSGAEQIILRQAAIAMLTSYTERTPKYTPDTREDNAKHSYMLALVAIELFPKLFPHLDVGLAVRYALVHEFPELLTGDIATFKISDEDLAVKTNIEHINHDYVCSFLPPESANLSRAYEEQNVLEAQIVRLIDKLLPFAVDILGPGSQVMHEDYDTHCLADLEEAQQILIERYQSKFPYAVFEPLHVALRGLANEFERVFEPNPQYALF